MNKYPLINFTLLQIYSNRAKHFSIFIIAMLLIMLLSSFMFIQNSILKDINITLDKQPDFIVQKIAAGKLVDTPISIVDELLQIDGISQASQRVYGRFFYEPAEHYFTIVGVDLYDEQIQKNLKELVKDLDISEFLSKKHMIIGNGVKEFLDEYHFFKYYNFRPADKSIEKVFIYDTFPKNSNIVSSDTIIMDISLAKTILGIDQEYSTDILYNVPNVDERETIKNKVRASNDFDIRVVSKEDLAKEYSGFINYKSSVFMILYLIALVTFILIIYQRYSYINSVEKKEIATLRALGWSINRIIRLKLIENFIIFFFAYLVGVLFAYIFVFIFDAPILNSVFLGFSNLTTTVEFIPSIDFGGLVLIFMFFIVPIMASILIPVWKISIEEPVEAMR